MSEQAQPMTLQSAGTGWSRGYRSEDPVEPQHVQIGPLLVPTRFYLQVVDLHRPDGEPDQETVLMYRADPSGQIALAQVFSTPMDASDALAFLRERQPLDDWKRTALVTWAARAASDALLGRSPSDEEWGEAVELAMGAAATVPIARRRNRVTPQHLEAVAEVYRSAWASGNPPTRAVAEAFSASHSTAARWVGMARKSHLLGQPAGPQGGELAQ